jgi:alpha-tubulin suppressor-like RCC1 family protein
MHTHVCSEHKKKDRSLEYNMNLDISFSSLAESNVFFGHDGKLYHWGNNTGFHQPAAHLDHPTDTPHLLPFFATSRDLDIISYSSGLKHTVAATRDGRVWAWGRSDMGQYVRNAIEEEEDDHPTLVPIPEKVTKVCCGAFYSAAISEEGNLYGWGYNSSGQVGSGAFSTQATPVKIIFPGDPQVVDVSCGFAHTLALTADGALYSWGRNDNGELGVPGEENATTPIPVEIPGTITKIFATFHSLVQTTDGSLYGWGWNGFGALGLGDEDARMEPTLVLQEKGLVVASGGAHVLALRPDGRLLVWGNNEEGQLGLGDKEHRLSPVEHPHDFNDERIRFVGCGNDHSIVITEGKRGGKDGGRMWIWGMEGNRVLGVEKEEEGDEEGEHRMHPRVLEVEWGWRLPPLETEREWQERFKWLWLGRGETECPFSDLPIEVFFHFVSMEY